MKLMQIRDENFQSSKSGQFIKKEFDLNPRKVWLSGYIEPYIFTFLPLYGRKLTRLFKLQGLYCERICKIVNPIQGL